MLIIYSTAQFKLDIYMRVTCDFMDNFLMSLVSYMQLHARCEQICLATRELHVSTEQIYIC